MAETGPERGSLNDEAVASRDDTQEMDDILKMLTKLDLDTAYISEKLVNLHVLLMHILASDNDLEATIAMTDSAESVEKVLVFDLLSGILESELMEVDELLDLLDAQIIDVSFKIPLCRQMKEVYVIMGSKLHDSAESLKQSRGQVSEITLQLAQLQKTLRYIKDGKSEKDESTEIPRNIQLKDISGKLRRPMDLKQRRVLRMLEKTLSRELDLEKKLSEFGQNEEQLKLKLHHTEQVSLRMEEASEVIWGRFLEAENASEILMGISKELLGRLQIVQFNLNGAVQRESELRSRLEDCMEQIRAKDLLLQKVEVVKAENMEIVSEVLTLRENVKSTEDKLRNAELELKSAVSSKQETLVQLVEMENAIESLKESLFDAETRAESGETKMKELTATNLELTEEINFLKETDDKNTKKVSSLEKQLRELEIQLQNSKASSEASQEQQNMLYSAIWDMETLIEDLKSKVSKADSKTEAVEEQCIVLSETNFELNKDLNFLRERVESLEALLNQANHEKEKSAKEINGRNKLLMDLVMQLATERERIKEQLYSLAKENEFLREKVHNTGHKLQTTVSINAGDCSEKELNLPTNDCKTKAFAKSLQEDDELTKDELEPDTLTDRSVSEEASMDSNDDATESTRASRLRPVWVMTAVLVLILSFFASVLFKQ